MKNKFLAPLVLCSVMALASCGGEEPTKLNHTELDNYILDTASAETLSIRMDAQFNRLVKTVDGKQEVVIINSLKEDEGSENTLLSDSIMSFSEDTQNYVEFKLLGDYKYKLINPAGEVVVEEVIDNGATDVNPKTSYVKLPVETAGLYTISFKGNLKKEAHSQSDFDGEIDKMYTFKNEHYSLLNFVPEGTSKRKDSTDLDKYDRGQYFTGEGSTVYVLNHTNGILSKLEGLVISEINEEGKVKILDKFCEVSFTDEFKFGYFEEF